MSHCTAPGWPIRAGRCPLAESFCLLGGSVPGHISVLHKNPPTPCPLPRGHPLASPPRLSVSSLPIFLLSHLRPSRPLLPTSACVSLLPDASRPHEMGGRAPCPQLCPSGGLLTTLLRNACEQDYIVQRPPSFYLHPTQSHPSRSQTQAFSSFVRGSRGTLPHRHGVSRGAGLGTLAMGDGGGQGTHRWGSPGSSGSAHASSSVSHLQRVAAGLT